MVAVLWPSSATGQGYPPCFPAEKLEQRLRDDWKEVSVSVGLTGGGWLIERWESETGTWTLTVRSRRGFLCVLAAGSNWREIPKELRDMAL